MRHRRPGAVLLRSPPPNMCLFTLQTMPAITVETVGGRLKIKPSPQTGGERERHLTLRSALSCVWCGLAEEMGEKGAKHLLQVSPDVGIVKTRIQDRGESGPGEGLLVHKLARIFLPTRDCSAVTLRVFHVPYIKMQRRRAGTGRRRPKFACILSARKACAKGPDRSSCFQSLAWIGGEPLSFFPAWNWGWMMRIGVVTRVRWLPGGVLCQSFMVSTSTCFTNNHTLQVV